MLSKAVLATVLASGLAAGAAACTGSAAGVVDRDILLPKERDTISAVVPANATFDSLLRAQNVDVATTQAVVSTLTAAFNPRALKASQPYWIVRTLDGQFREFRYEIDSTKYLRVKRAPAGPGEDAPYVAEVIAYPREVETAAASAEISAEHNSLIGAFEASGENIQLPLLLSEVFGGIIDFNT